MITSVHEGSTVESLVRSVDKNTKLKKEEEGDLRSGQDFYKIQLLGICYAYVRLLDIVSMPSVAIRSEVT